MRLLQRACTPFRERMWKLDPEHLKAEARAQAGLTDFGEDAPLDEPLEALCRSTRTELRLSTNGLAR